MTLADWLRESRSRVERHGLERGLSASANEFWVGALRRIGRTWNYGESIYEREWDVLIVLDACRVDLLQAVADGGAYPFLPATVPDVASVGSMSEEWMAKNFEAGYDEEVARTAYVTGNPFSRGLDGDRFARFDEVWRYGWDDEFGGIPPRPITDRAVAAGREGGFDRLIVHYMQPHIPFREMPDASVGWGDPEAEFGNRRGGVGEGRGAWERLRDGDLPLDTLWEAYRDNLEWVLDDVALLLENLDAERAVVTADHGNAMGEWWIYGHPDHMLVPALKRVPWVETTAHDDHTFAPTLEPAARSDDSDGGVDERLDALGYR